MGETNENDPALYEELPVIALAGEIDLAVAPSLQERLDLLFSNGETTIVVDLLEATFLDSIALGVLVGALEQCRKDGGELHLVVTEPRILKVLEITGLVSTFPIHSTPPPPPPPPSTPVHPKMMDCANEAEAVEAEAIAGSETETQ